MNAVFDSDITAEIIPDGKHVHPSMLRLLIKIKGVEKTIAVTDSAAPTGLEDGEYKLGENNIVLDNGNLWLRDDRTTRAGSVLTMIDALSNIINMCDLSIVDASRLVSENPAKLLGFSNTKGVLLAGYDADFIILDNKFDVCKTFVMGKEVYSK